MDVSLDTHGRLCFGSFEPDVRSRELRAGATRIRLREQPFEILPMMLERPGNLVTRDELRRRLRPDGTFAPIRSDSRYARLIDLLGLG